MSMTIRALRRIFSPQAAGETVHFHLRSDGQPFVCDVPHCDSPAVRPSEFTRGPRPTA